MLFVEILESAVRLTTASRHIIEKLLKIAQQRQRQGQA